MASASMNRNLVLFSKRHPADAQSLAWEEAFLERCRSESWDCLVIPSLYSLAESSKIWKSLAEQIAEREQVVLLCHLHPRPAHWLLRRHHITVDESRILNLAAYETAEAEKTAETVKNIDAVKDVEKAVAKLFGIKPKQDKNASQKIASQKAPSNKTTSKSQRLTDEPETPIETKILRSPVRDRWYPVVDGSRCIQCGHCLQFCLFGVYALDAEGKVYVHQPDSCKPGCPACSRICPQSAIMFPLYEKDSAIAGSPGEFVVIDPDARKMFYMRTKQTCPICGRKPEKKKTSNKSDPTANRVCPECGFALPINASEDFSPPNASPTLKKSSMPEKSSDKAAFDDLDLLVDQLDQSMRRKG
jgi:NAD-dependent dihydropyrimidine dehydrogenase PreA subunit